MVPKRKRVQREHTEDWQTIQQYTLWPEQTAYELLRPIVLFGEAKPPLRISEAATHFFAQRPVLCCQEELQGMQYFYCDMLSTR
jgi:hypothetical protein